MSNAITTVDFNAPTLVNLRDHAMGIAEACVEIVDTPTCEQAVRANAEVAKAITLIGKERLAFTRQLDAAKKEIMAKEKEFCAPLQEATEVLTQAINDHMGQIRRAQAEQVERIKQQEQAIGAVEKAAGQDHAVPALIASEPVVDAPNVPTRMVARLVVTTPSKVPQQFWKLDEAKLMQYLKDTPAAVNMGAHLEWDEVMVRRAI